MSPAPTFPALLEAFFVDRLIRQRQSSPHTIASYRDTFRLLLHHAQQTLRKAPSDLAITDLDTPFLGAFLDHIEKERDNSARSRNVRLAAIHSFFRYVALHAPEHSALAQRVLAMPSKRYVRRPIAFLTSVEVTALLAAPDLNSWGGRRDRALLTLAVQTGLRAAELLGLRCSDIVLGQAAHVQCQGKGRKLRNTPLRKDAVAVLRGWLTERQGQPTDIVFPTMAGTALSHDALQYMLDKHLAVARRNCPSLVAKRVTPHVLRHYVPSRTMSRAFCFKAVFCRISPSRRDIVRPLRQGLIPERTCSDTDLSDLALVRAQQRRRKAPPVESWHI